MGSSLCPVSALFPREAAYALCLYVYPPPNLEFDPPFARQCQRTILELGAGTGIVSSRIAEVLGPGTDILIATDLPDVCITPMIM